MIREINDQPVGEVEHLAAVKKFKIRSVKDRLSELEMHAVGNSLDINAFKSLIAGGQL
jgi:hypothetical protein